MTKEEKKEYNRAYRIANRARMNEIAKRYYENNKGVVLARNEGYRRQNLDKIARYKTKYIREKRQTNLSFRLQSNLQRRICLALNGKDKASSTVKLIGCSIAELKKHLESKFTEGMTWENYGQWHVDHIKPCALFDLTLACEQEKCFNYTNLQPLWALDNLRKRDKYD